ncbi:MAG: cation transport ATPase [Paracoccaceae bacterium]
MSTWISKGAFAGLCLILAGCVAGQAGFSTSRAAPVLGGAVQVGLPAGYCIDRRAGREAGDTAVVVMGKCRDDADAAPALLTTAIGPAGSADVLAGGGETLAGYFTSDAGRAALSRTGRASAVEIVQAKSVGAAFVMRIRDRAVGEYWRGVEPVAGRLVTITVDLPEGTEADGEALLLAALAAMQRANPAP